MAPGSAAGSITNHVVRRIAEQHRHVAGRCRIARDEIATEVTPERLRGGAARRRILVHSEPRREESGSYLITFPGEAVHAVGVSDGDSIGHRVGVGDVARRRDLGGLGSELVETFGAATVCYSAGPNGQVERKA